MLITRLDWDEYGLKPMELDWELTLDDLQFSMPFGIKMENSVITKPYSIAIDASSDELSMNMMNAFSRYWIEMANGG